MKQKLNQIVSIFLSVLSVCIWVLFAVSWIMSYFESVAYTFPASHFWWICLAVITINSFWCGYNNASKPLGGSLSQKVLIFSGIKQVFLVAGCIVLLVGCLAIWGRIDAYDDNCSDYIADYSTGWSYQCVAPDYENDYYEENYKNG